MSQIIDPCHLIYQVRDQTNTFSLFHGSLILLNKRISRCYQPTYWLFASEEMAIVVIHKLGNLSGEGVSQLIILLHKPYFVKVAT